MQRTRVEGGFRSDTVKADGYVVISQLVCFTILKARS